MFKAYLQILFRGLAVSDPALNVLHSSSSCTAALKERLVWAQLPVRAVELHQQGCRVWLCSYCSMVSCH